MYTLADKIDYCFESPRDRGKPGSSRIVLHYFQEAGEYCDIAHIPEPPSRVRAPRPQKFQVTHIVPVEH